MKSEELDNLRHYIEWLKQRQYDLMPLSENKRVAHKLADYLAKYKLLSRKTSVKIEHHKMAYNWALFDEWHGRPNLHDQIYWLIGLANKRVGDNCIDLLNEKLREYDYLEAHHASNLANDVWNDMNNEHHFVNVIGRLIDESYGAYRHHDYYHAYVYAYKLRHLLNLAKPAKKPPVI